MDKREMLAVFVGAMLLGTAGFSLQNAYEQGQQIQETKTALHRDMKEKDAKINQLNHQVKDLNTKAQVLQGRLDQSNKDLTDLKKSVSKIASDLPF